MAMFQDRIQPVDFGRALALGVQFRQSGLAEEQHRFQLEQLYEQRDRSKAFREALVAGDANAARAADPQAFAKLQEQQLGVQKTQLDLSKSRTEETQRLQESSARAIGANPRLAQAYQNEVNRRAQRGEVDAFNVVGADTANTVLEPGQVGPEALPTRAEARTAVGVAGGDALKGLDGGVKEYIQTHPNDDPSVAGFGARYDAWNRANKRSGASSVNVGGKVLGASAVSELSDLDTAIGSVDQLVRDYNATVPSNGTAAQIGSRVTSLVPNTVTSQYQNNADVAAQSIGTILEGGKLTETDLQRYKRMLPQPGDSPETAQRKAENMKAQLRRKLADRKSNLGSAGYRVPDKGAKTFRSNETDATLDALLNGGQ